MKEKIPTKNLAILSPEEIKKIKIDLAAGNIAFRERYGMSTNIKRILQEYSQSDYILFFNKRLAIYRLAAKSLPCLPYKKLYKQ